MSEHDEPATPWTSEKPRYLAPRGRPGDTINGERTGYVTKPWLGMRDEPECVGPAILGDYAEVAQLHRSQQHALDVAQAQERRPELTPQNRLDDIHRRARYAHVDLSHPIHLVQRAIDKARLREQPVTPSALDRLAGLEALLDGVDLRDAA